MLLAAETDTAGVWKPNPSIAAALSFAIPGAGQVYNHSYWKAPIALGLEGYAGWVAYDAHRTMLDAEEQGRIYEEGTAEYEAEKSRWEKARERRNINLWILTGLVFISTIDAYVDAHLFDWTREMARPIEPKKSEVTLAPVIDPDGGVGLSLSLSLNLP